MPDPIVSVSDYSSTPLSTNASTQTHENAKRAIVRSPLFIVIWRIVIVIASLIGVVLLSKSISGFTIKVVYFTVQSNIMVIICMGYAAWATLRKASRPAPVIKGAVIVYILIASLVYNLILASISGPSVADGLDIIVPVIGGKLSNDLLHVLTPLMVLLDWLLFDVHGRFQWRYAVQWLTYPLAYVIFILIRGVLFTGPFVSPNFHYPYPFLNVDQIGYGGVAVNTVIYGVAFWLLGFVLVVLDRALARFNR